MTTIEILDLGGKEYKLKFSSKILGNQYENGVNTILVVKPDAESENVCTMIVSYGNKTIDLIVVEDEEISITSNISQFEHVRIAFAFTNDDGYVKNSESALFDFLPAEKPTDFVAEFPEIEQNYLTLYSYAFTDCENEDGTLIFKNYDRDTVDTVEGFATQSTLEESVTDLQAQITTECEAVQANLDAFIDISAGRIVTDADTGNVGEIFNDYKNNVASGALSHSEGYSTSASGAYTHAEGWGTTASGNYGSHAEGWVSTASGGMSHAEGWGTTASGDASHAEGFLTTASGGISHSEGAGTTASGDASHAEGYGTVADQTYQTVVGVYNLTEQEGSLFAVGNGTDDDARSTAFEVFQDGHAEVSGDLQVRGNITDGANSIAVSDIVSATDIESEASARESADSTLQTNIDAETTARADADTTLQTNIDNLGLASGASLALSIDSSTYVMTLNLLNSEGTILSTETVDLPLETMVVSASYSDGMLYLTLQNGTTLEGIDISSIIDGLVSQTDFDTLEAQVSTNTADIATNKANIATNTANIATNTADISTNASAIATETSERTTVDATLQSNIDSEVSARTSADTTLQEQITSNDDDIAALQATDTTLQGNIDAEATTRVNAVTDLQNQITTNTTNIATNTSDISDLKTQVQTNKTNIESLTQGVDLAALQTQLDTNTANISTNTSDISANATAISTEISDRESADSDLQSQITANATAISTEASTRSSADETLQTNIDGKVPKSVTNNNYESIVDNGELAVGQVLVDVIDNTQSKEGTVTVDGSQIALQIYDFSSSGTYPASVVLNTSGVNIGGKTYVQSLYVSGDIVQEGDSYVTEAEHLKVEDSLIFTRNGASVGLTDDEYTGLVASNYDGKNYGALIYDNAGVARVGDVTITEGTDAEGNATQTVDASATQPLATRAEADDLTDTGVVYWDAENQRFVTSDDLTVNNSAGRIVTDSSTGNVGEVFNDYTNNVASGYYSHAEGWVTTASRTGSHAEGSYTTASGAYSHAEGNYTQATGSFGSHAEGYYATANGERSHAEGSYTTANGSGSHAEGSGTTANGSSSHAEGYGTTASSYSHAEGYGTTASGKGSHAGGGGTIADQDYQTALGIANIEGQEGSLFAVGNGVYNSNTEIVSTRSNAFEVFQDGHAEVSGDLQVSGNITDGTNSVAVDDIVTLSTEQTITGLKNFTGSIEINGQYIISVDSDGNLAINNVDSTLTTMSISLNGGVISYDADTDTFTI